MQSVPEPKENGTQRGLRKSLAFRVITAAVFLLLLFTVLVSAVGYIRFTESLTPGSKLSLCTDGVPEATNGNNEMFGTDRTLEALNQAPAVAPAQILRTVRQAVDGFVRDAEQFDDLTMLCLEYRGEGAAEK